MEGAIVTDEHALHIPVTVILYDVGYIQWQQCADLMSLKS